MDVTLTIRNARPQDVQQLLNLRRPRRDRSPLRRQRPHIQILSNQQQDALQALDFRAEQDTPSISRSVSRSHQELQPLPRRRPDEAYEGTRAKHKARPYSAFPRVRQAPTGSAASSSTWRPEEANRDRAPGAGDMDQFANLGVWSSPTRRSRRPSRRRSSRPTPPPSPSPSPSPRRHRSRSRRRGPSMEQRMQDEADHQRRQRQMPSTLVDTDVSMPHNLNQYNINWASFEVQGFQLPRQSQQYFAGA